MKAHAITVAALLAIWSFPGDIHATTTTPPVDAECAQHECQIDVKPVVTGTTCTVKLYWNGAEFNRLNIKKDEHGENNNGVILKWKLDNDTGKGWYFLERLYQAPVSLPVTNPFRIHEYGFKQYKVPDYNDSEAEFTYSVSLFTIGSPWICESDPTIYNHG